MTNIERADALYHTLRTLKDRDFDENKYKWVLGYEVFRDFRPFFIHQLAYPIEPTWLFGIVVERDMQNPFTFKLYEDITDQIAIPYEEFKEMEEQDEIQRKS